MLKITRRERDKIYECYFIENDEHGLFTICYGGFGSQVILDNVSKRISVHSFSCQTFFLYFPFLKYHQIAKAFIKK